MRGTPRRRVEELAGEGLVGFVLKKDSPSCGLERVKVIRQGRRTDAIGTRTVAEALARASLCSRSRTEGRLSDPGCARISSNASSRIGGSRLCFALRWSMGDVVRFTRTHELTLMVHMPEAYRRLGRLVALGASLPRREFQDRYSLEFLTALQGDRHTASPRQGAPARPRLFQEDAQSRKPGWELLALIEDYAAGRVSW